ncbi:MAG: hypothetical protein AOA66_1114 [Candidatus Bathyarchaeota archaeon BA2]|nr:MAG: hypothetical protein AOA66_1114 [Candidatus Bathyarchaeota archaeon BA2]
MKRLSALVSDEEYKRVKKLVGAGAAKSCAELVREAVRKYVEDLGSSKLLSFKEISPLEARQEIEHYLKNHPGVVWPDDMAERLGIDYRLTLQIVQELLREEKVEVVKLKRGATEK